MRRQTISAILGIAITLFFFLGIAVLLSGCLPEQKDSNTQESGIHIHTPIDDHNARTALDWDGIYRGTLPCADCPGILTELTLNQDGSYYLKSTYLERSVSPRESSGRFQWEEDGNHITLPGPENLHYRISENHVVQLDSEGQDITGPLADLYILKKQTVRDENDAVTERYWKLTELRGQPIGPFANEPHLILKEDDNSVIGSGGCNRLMGQYEITGDGNIQFSKMASTRMACSEGMDIENALLAILGDVDHYTLNGDTLLFNQGDTAPLARFEAVYLR